MSKIPENYISATSQKDDELVDLLTDSARVAFLPGLLVACGHREARRKGLTWYEKLQALPGYYLAEALRGAIYMSLLKDGAIALYDTAQWITERTTHLL